MIKILHLADLHIGMENYGRLDPNTGLHSRLLDYLERFDEAIAFGMEEQVDLVVIAGDIYKNRTPNPTHQREFARRINQLRSAGVPVFILTGNHDISASLGKAHSIEIFDALTVEGVTIADRLRTHLIPTRSGPVQIIALPWVTRHALLTRDEMRLASFGEIEAELRRRIERFIEGAVANLDPNIPTILAVHATVEGAEVGAERSITLGQDLVFTRSTLARPELDYVAMGHIHRHQAIGQHPPIVYPGSIERIDFGEREEQKGCVLVELERNNTRWRFHPLAARPFISIEVDIRESSDPAARITAAIARHHLAQAIVRLDVAATREQTAHLREDVLRTQLETAGAFLVAAITFTVERTTRGRFGDTTQELLDGLTPRRALELYLKSKQTDPARMELLLAAADELIAQPGD